MEKTQKFEFTYRIVPVSKMFADYTYQRPVNEKWLRSIVRNFDLSLANTITLSDRGDGQYAIIDGNHTANAIQICLGDDYSVLCKVYIGLTVSNEADMFFKLNKQRKSVNIAEKIKAGIVAGEASSVRYIEYMEKHGFPYSFASHGNGFKCHAAILRHLKSYNEDDVAQAMSICEEATRNTDEYCRVQYFFCASLICRAYNDYDRNRLVSTFRKIAVTNPGAVDGARSGGGFTLSAKKAAEYIVEQYNKGKHGCNRLDPEMIYRVGEVR